MITRYFEFTTSYGTKIFIKLVGTSKELSEFIALALENSQWQQVEESEFNASNNPVASVRID